MSAESAARRRRARWQVAGPLVGIAAFWRILASATPMGFVGGWPSSQRVRIVSAWAVKVDNPYDLIGVSRAADKDEVRKIFRKRTVQEHPDVNPDDPEAAERFTELVNAYNKIMGDELLPDELMELRVKATKQYSEKLEKEFRGQIEMGNANSFRPLLLAVIFGLIFAFILWLQDQSMDTLSDLGILPKMPR